MDESKKPKKNGEVLIKPLRTYEDDVKSAIYDRQISTAKILVSEQKKKQRLERETAQEGFDGSKNKLFLKWGAALLVVSILVIIYISFVHPIIFREKKVSIKPVSDATLIYVQDQVEVSVSDKRRVDILSEIRNIIEEPIPTGSLKEIVITKSDTTDDLRTTKKKITTENLFEILGTPIANRAIRSLGSEFVLGIHGMVVSEPYIVIEVDDFQNAFAGMLEWEPVIISDIRSIFFERLEEKEFEIEEETVATTTPETGETGTTTPKEPVVVKRLNYTPNNFEDVVLNNKDTRAIRNFGGDIIFFYSFIDEKHMLMTTNRETLGEIIRRFKTKSLAQ